MTRVEFLIEHILGPCDCGPEYEDRGLRSPSCGHCRDGHEAREAILLAYQLGWDESERQDVFGKGVVEANRPDLAQLLGALERRNDNDEPE